MKAANMLNDNELKTPLNFPMKNFSSGENVMQFGFFRAINFNTKLSLYNFLEINFFSGQ